MTKVTGSTTTTTVPATSNKISAVGAAAYTYDLAGNITGDGSKTYTWNAAGQLETVKVGATTVGTYTYDYLGRRAKKVAGATTTHYVYGPNGVLYGEYSATGTLAREYVYLNDAPLAQIATGSPEVLTYLHTDHLGTPRYATNTAGTQVWAWPSDAFGISTPTGTVTVNLRLPGQYFDSESGNFYNWNRYYNPNIGRYMSPDPIGQEGGLNLFSYVGQNPIMASDPMGLQTVPLPVPGLPIAIPPVAIPGFPENKAWTQTASEFSREMAYCMLAGPTTSACMMSQNLNNGMSIQGKTCSDAQVHGNSNLSPRPTEVYYLINRDTGVIDKIGITSASGARYSQSYLDAEHVFYEPQTQYSSRYPAKVDENIRLFYYRVENGQLPRLNKTTY